MLLGGKKEKCSYNSREGRKKLQGESSVALLGEK